MNLTWGLWGFDWIMNPFVQHTELLGHKWCAIRTWQLSFMSNGVLEGGEGSWVQLRAVRANRMRDWWGNRNRNRGGARRGKIDATCHRVIQSVSDPLCTKMTFMWINSHRNRLISPSISSALFPSLPCNRALPGPRWRRGNRDNRSWLIRMVDWTECPLTRVTEALFGVLLHYFSLR